MDDVFAYLTRLPDGVREFVAPCPDGYTVYIDSRLDDDSRRAAYYHALHHIDGHDWTQKSVQVIEQNAHISPPVPR